MYMLTDCCMHAHSFCIWFLAVCRYPQQLPSLTQQAMSTSSPVELTSSALDSNTSSAASPSATCGATSLMSDSTASGVPASWLTPQQLQSRPLGEMEMHASMSCMFLHDQMLLIKFAANKPHLHATGDFACKSFVTLTCSTHLFYLDACHAFNPVMTWKIAVAGMKVAKMISSHRTPIGAFANFDLPIAP